MEASGPPDFRFPPASSVRGHGIAELPHGTGERLLARRFAAVPAGLRSRATELKGIAESGHGVADAWTAGGGTPVLRSRSFAGGKRSGRGVRHGTSLLWPGRLGPRGGLLPESARARPEQFDLPALRGFERFPSRPPPGRRSRDSGRDSHPPQHRSGFGVVSLGVGRRSREAGRSERRTGGIRRGTRREPEFRESSGTKPEAAAAPQRALIVLAEPRASAERSV